jgi:hypothetical protein
MVRHRTARFLIGCRSENSRQRRANLQNIEVIMSELPWIAARKHIGQMEIKGPRHNPLILQFWKDIKRGGIKDDETPWCAAFVGAMLSDQALSQPDSSRQNPISTGEFRFENQLMVVWWYSVVTAEAMSDLLSVNSKMEI